MTVKLGNTFMSGQNPCDPFANEMHAQNDCELSLFL